MRARNNLRARRRPGIVRDLYDVQRTTRLPSFDDERCDEGIESYINDAPIDIGVQNTVSDKNNPAFGTALGLHLARQRLLLDSLSS